MDRLLILMGLCLALCCGPCAAQTAINLDDDKSEKSGKADKTENADKSGKEENSDKSDKAENSDKSDKDEKAESTADPVVLSGDRLMNNVDVTGQSVIIDATKSTIAVRGSCRDLTVNGSDNNIRSCKLERLSVRGNSNLVTYPSNCKPKLSDTGKSNSVIGR